MKSFYFRYKEDTDIYYWGELKSQFICTTVKGSPWHRCSEEEALKKLRKRDWIITDFNGNDLEENTDGYL
jgi:hypothetical protein